MDGWKTGFLLGWLPGRGYVSFREKIFWTFLQSSKSRKSKFLERLVYTLLRMNISPEGPGTFEDDDDFANFPLGGICWFPGAL